MFTSRRRGHHRVTTPGTPLAHCWRTRLRTPQPPQVHRSGYREPTWCPAQPHRVTKRKSRPATNQSSRHNRHVRQTQSAAGCRASSKVSSGAGAPSARPMPKRSPARTTVIKTTSTSDNHLHNGRVHEPVSCLTRLFTWPKQPRTEASAKSCTASSPPITACATPPGAACVTTCCRSTSHGPRRGNAPARPTWVRGL